MTDLVSSRVLQDPLSSPIDIHSAHVPAPGTLKTQVAAMASAADAFQQRHTFASASGFSDDDALIASATSSPPTSSSLPSDSEASARLGSHVQHYRVYGRSEDGDDHNRSDDHNGPCFVDVAAPAPTTVWTRGKPAEIFWRVVDPSVSTVRIELIEEGCAGITVIAANAPNSGSFSYSRVPWGMPCSHRYFLHISATSDPSRFLTTPLFTIDSAP